MKKILCTAFAVLALTGSVYAADDVNIIVQGEGIEMKGSIIDGRTLVPVRGVFEGLGYTDITFDAETKTAVLKNAKNDTLEITAGNDSFKFNNTAIKTDVPQQIINGRFMLPLRAVGEAVGAKVDWDSETRTASIRKGLIVKNTLKLE